MPLPGSVLQVVQPEDGGVAEHVRRLAAGLLERGWDVHVAASPGNGAIPALRAAGASIHELSFVRRPGPGDVAAARALRAIDARGRFDIVHAHSSKAGALVRAALPRRRRLVYTPHCFAFAASFGGGGSRLLYRAAEQALTPRSGAIVAVCDWERRVAARDLRGAAARTRVIENGVPECAAAEPHPELVEFAAGRPLAGFVGVLRPQKEPLLAIRAAAQLRERGELHGALAMVGNGELRDAVTAEIDRLGLGDSVRWFPFEGAVGPYLAAIDVFVLPSAWEALPLAVLEAMSCGVPVLATAVGGVPDVIDDGRSGRLVPPRDATALAAALGELLGDPALRDALAAAARDTWAERFRVERMVDENEALYAELLGARPKIRSAP